MTYSGITIIIILKRWSSRVGLTLSLLLYWYEYWERQGPPRCFWNRVVSDGYRHSGLSDNNWAVVCLARHPQRNTERICTLHHVFRLPASSNGRSSMCVCVYIYIYIYIHTYIDIYIYECVCACVFSYFGFGFWMRSSRNKIAITTY